MKEAILPDGLFRLLSIAFYNLIKILRRYKNQTGRKQIPTNRIDQINEPRGADPSHNGRHR
jgi:hypothetical protein